MNTYPHDKIYFTSDLHAFHTNIIKLNNRPFTDVVEMNNYFIEQWNMVIPPDGIVINCGDVCMKTSKFLIKQFLQQLNGNHILILGNHDRESIIPKECFAEIHQQLIFSVTGDEEFPNRIIHACHYPMLSWYHVRRGGLHIYGHTHQNDELNTHPGILAKMGKNCLNVGVDNCGFRPLNWKDFKIKLQKHNAYIDKLQPDINK